MLESPDEVMTSSETETDSNKGISSGLPVQELTNSLVYLRDRIGVPRDMSIHGARQFRSYINWMINAINNK